MCKRCACKERGSGEYYYGMDMMLLFVIIELLTSFVSTPDAMRCDAMRDLSSFFCCWKQRTGDVHASEHEGYYFWGASGHGSGFPPFGLSSRQTTSRLIARQVAERHAMQLRALNSL